VWWIAHLLAVKYPAMSTAQTESTIMARFILCRPVLDPFAYQLAERRRFQSLEVALSGRRLRQKMLGDFERGGGSAAIETRVEQHFVQRPAQHSDRCGVVAHAPCYIRRS
jgi:hypothetical protein